MALLCVVYAAVGLATGLLLAGILRAAVAARSDPPPPPAALPTVAALTIVPPFAANLNGAFGARLTATTLVWAFLLLAAAAAATRRAGWARALLHVVERSWSLPLTLVGSAWLLRDLLAGTRSSYRFAVMGGCVVAAAAAGRLALESDRAGVRSWWAPLRALVPPLVAMGLLLGVLYLYVEPAPRLSVSRGGRPASADQPDIVLIVLDTVRAANLSLYGYARDTTPNLRELAKEASLYTQAVAPGDMTLSTHASMFTGLYAREHGAHYNDKGLGRPLDARFKTLAERLSDVGYATLGVAANHVFFGTGYGLEQGFDSFDARPTPQYIIMGILHRNSGYLLRAPVCRQLRRMLPASTHMRLYRRAARINSVAFEILDEAAARGSRLFLFLNYMDAHWPYFPPAPYRSRWPGEDPDYDMLAHDALIRDVVRDRRRSIRDVERAHLLSQYDGAIAYIDSQIGHLVDRLKQLGMYDRCLLIITSDHGEAFGEGDLVDHGVGAFEHQAHVPLLIKYPGSQEGRVVDRAVSLVDVLPTALEVAAGPLPQILQGRNLRDGTTSASEPVVSESFPNVGYLGARFARIQRAIYDGTFKYLHTTTGRRELYDLSTDPFETTDLSGRRAPRIDRMQQHLDDWLSSRTPPPKTDAKSDERTLRRLRAMGYLE